MEIRRLTVNDGDDVYMLLQAIPENENGFINKMNGRTREDFRQWLAACEASAEKTEIEDGWRVPQAIYWLYVDGKPVGMGKLRYFLTDALRQSGGQIGYAIVPEARRRGYGKLLLKGLLQEAKKHGIDRALITVHNDNPASIRVAMACGGVIEDVDDVRHRIWIDC